MKTLLSLTVAKWFKSIKVAGAFRFWCFYWAYRLWPGLHIRHKEWDWVLSYLPHLHNEHQQVKVLDVGCSRNLFVHELSRRGYDVYGIDIEDYQDVFPGTFQKLDITKHSFYEGFDFITCISVLEHVYDGDNDKQCMAISNMADSLLVGGRLLLTIPTHEFSQGHPWHGFDYRDLINFKEYGLEIGEYKEGAGQILVSFIRV